MGPEIYFTHCQKVSHTFEQYRMVSLTSHIRKIFERVIKKELIKHLTENEMFNKGQHAFVPGRSMQMQLLSHFNDIFDTIIHFNNYSL